MNGMVPLEKIQECSSCSFPAVTPEVGQILKAGTETALILDFLVFKLGEINVSSLSHSIDSSFVIATKWKTHDYLSKV